jgi:hypothetical protein
MEAAVMGLDSALLAVTNSAHDKNEIFISLTTDTGYISSQADLELLGTFIHDEVTTVVDVLRREVVAAADDLSAVLCAT